MKRMIFWAAALLVLGSGSAAFAANEQCFAEKGARSTESTSPTTITFESEAPIVVRLYELDSDGKRVPRGELEPGRTASHETYATHPWVNAGPDGNCRGIFFAQAQPRTVPAH